MAELTLVRAELAAIKAQNADLGQAARDVLGSELDRIEAECLALVSGALRQQARLIAELEAGGVLSADSLRQRQAAIVRGLSFPLALRKMWSGGEVQDWLWEQADLLAQGMPAGDPETARA